MTIDVSNNNPRIEYSVSQGASQSVFTVPFEFFDNSDVKVYVDDALKSEGADYSLAGGDGSTGTLTFSSPVVGATGGSIVVLARHTSLERTTDFVAGQDINRAALNEQLDTIVAQIADLDDRVDRTIHLNDSEVAPSMLLTDDRKGRVMAFNSSTGAVEAGPLSNDIATIADNIAEILAADDEAAAAAASATAAATSASAASTSATAAQTAQTAAELAETNAETAETNAETAETNAAASAAAALASKTAASTSETNAAASEAASSTSETNAAASAAAASTSETNAATSETNAANSATASASSATASAASATAASASETAASASETAAAASEAAASTSETNAAASETAAAASETAAASSASSASTSASNAASSASSASASADAALAALDNFDDRYLGQKASDPTLDNDGDALVAGALYFNTTDDVMKVYEGSAWVAAYASLSGALLVANNLSDLASASAGRTNLGLGTGDSPTFAGLTTTGNVSFGDNDKAIFGAGSDLQIYHDGSASYIDDAGTGRLNIRANDRLYLRDTNDSVYAVFYSGAGSFINHNGNTKLATTSTGIDVTGTVTADGLTVEDATPEITVSSTTLANLATIKFTSGGADVDSKITHQANTGVMTIDSGRSASWGGKIDFVTDTVKRANISNNGDISFYEDTGTTPKFFWDASAESLGIGTSSPLAALSVGAGSLSDANLPIQISTGASGNRYVGINKNGAYALLVGYEATADRAEIRNIQNTPIVFKTNDAERMRIDASGNLLVGTTSTDLVNNNGIVANSAGYLDVGRNALVARFTRRSTDGSIVEFRKDGYTVGSIGSNAGDKIYIGTSDTGLYFNYGGDAVSPYNPSAGAVRDAAISLGGVTTRWKDGHFSGTVNAANFNTTSDATLKTNVETLTGSLDAVNALRGVSFDWIENGGSEVGFIAQEVEEVLPEVVSTNDQGIKSVKYGNMVAVLVEAIKEQQLRIEALEAKLEG